MASEASGSLSLRVEAPEDAEESGETVDMGIAGYWWERT
jgi:hypothetical protein